MGCCWLWRYEGGGPCGGLSISCDRLPGGCASRGRCHVLLLGGMRLLGAVGRMGILRRRQVLRLQTLEGGPGAARSRKKTAATAADWRQKVGPIR